MHKFLALFVVIPIIDLLLIIKIGLNVGIASVIALIVIPGLLGAAMARSQGLSTLKQISGELARGVIPGVQIIDGILIVIGGIFLLIPGVISGMLGLTVLLPTIRKFYRNLLISYFIRRVKCRII